jgi:hypothetical protein
MYVNREKIARRESLGKSAPLLEWGLRKSVRRPPEVESTVVARSQGGVR